MSGGVEHVWKPNNLSEEMEAGRAVQVDSMKTRVESPNGFCA
jgi:hypothetical protein